VRIHATFLLLLASIGLLTLKQGGTAAALEAVVFLLTIFFCVLLHEFGHVMAARRYGIRTPDVTLLPIGGLARMERMPRKPQEELVVALAGPAVNVVIAAGLLLVLLVAPPVGWGFSIVEGSFMLRLMYWNIVMVMFNMIPAFPMDGGRVLRAVLAMIMDYARATRWAAAVGQAFAIVGALAAIFYFQNPLLIIIAVFIFMSAGQEAAFVSEQEAIQGLTVRDAMVTQFSHLREDAVLKDAVNLLLAGSQHDFPVVNWQGAFIGMLSRTALIAGLDQYGPQHPVAEVMQTCETTLDPRHPLTGAVEHLRASACPALPVIHPSEGSLMGLLTAENVGEMLMVRAALAKGRQSPGSLPA
jgi:stage IV sporulation protein FB